MLCAMLCGHKPGGVFMGKQSGVYQYLIVAVLALGFSSNFLFTYEVNGTNITYLSMNIAFKVLGLLVPAF